MTSHKNSACTSTCVLQYIARNNILFCLGVKPSFHLTSSPSCGPVGAGFLCDGVPILAGAPGLRWRRLSWRSTLCIATRPLLGNFRKWKMGPALYLLPSSTRTLRSTSTRLCRLPACGGARNVRLRQLRILNNAHSDCLSMRKTIFP